MKQGVNLPKRNPGESDKDYDARIIDWCTQDTARSKDDNKEWTGSPTFHLDRS